MVWMKNASNEIFYGPGKIIYKILIAFILANVTIE